VERKCVCTNHDITFSSGDCGLVLVPAPGFMTVPWTIMSEPRSDVPARIFPELHCAHWKRNLAGCGDCFLQCTSPNDKQHAAFDFQMGPCANIAFSAFKDMVPISQSTNSTVLVSKEALAELAKTNQKETGFCRCEPHSCLLGLLNSRRKQSLLRRNHPHNVAAFQSIFESEQDALRVLLWSVPHHATSMIQMMQWTCSFLLLLGSTVVFFSRRRTCADHGGQACS